MRGAAVAISAGMFGWVVLQAQGGCGAEPVVAEPDEPTAVEAPAVEAESPAAPTEPAPAEPAPAEPAPAEPSPPELGAEGLGLVPNTSNAGNVGNTNKAFFPASKSGVMPTLPEDPAPQQQQQHPNPAPRG